MGCTGDLFDYNDIDYLAMNLTIRQLRDMVLKYGIKAAIHRSLSEDDEERYCSALVEASESAIAVRNYLLGCDRRQNPLPTTRRSGHVVDVRSIKARLDLVGIIGRYTKLTKAGRCFRGLCPFHSEKNPSFFVYPEKRYWHCYGSCNAGGDLIAFIMRAEKTDFKGALSILGSGV